MVPITTVATWCTWTANFWADIIIIVVTSYGARAHPPWSLNMYTNLAVSVYIYLQWASGRLVVNITYFPVTATDSQSKLYFSCSQFSFPVYYIYVEISANFVNMHAMPCGAPPGSKYWWRHWSSSSSLFKVDKAQPVQIVSRKIRPVRDWRSTSLECIGVGDGGAGEAIIWDRRLQVCHFACSSVYCSLYFINFLFDSVW